MKIDKRNLVIAGAAGILILAVIAFFAFRSGGGSRPTPTETTTQQIQKPSAAKPSIAQSPVVSQQLVQNGLYTIDYKNFVSASLTERYSFVSDLLKSEEAFDTPGQMLPPQMSDNINLAEIVIPKKDLTLVFIYTNTTGFCMGKYCTFSLYVKRPDGYQSYMGLFATEKSYIMIEDKSVSVITCSDYSPNYQQWRLEDGALEKPIPANSPGHFVPVGAFKHDKIASCP